MKPITNTRKPSRRIIRDTLALQKQFPNLVTLRTFSKAHALAGLRVGYGFADPDIISALDRVRPPFNVSAMAQAGAEASLKDAARIQRAVKHVAKEKSKVLPAITKLHQTVLPSVGNFVLIDISPRKGQEMFESLLRRGIIVRSMDEYGYPHHIRVTFGLAAENQLFLKAFSGGSEAMILTLKPQATKGEIEAITKKIKDLGFSPHMTHGKEFTIIGVIGENAIRTRDIFEAMAGVESITPISKPYKLVSREFKKENSVIDLGRGVTIGGPGIVVMAGPCSVDTKERLLFTAEAVKDAGGPSASWWRLQAPHVSLRFSRPRGKSSEIFSRGP